jgi:hypothetical protein
MFLFSAICIVVIVMKSFHMKKTSIIRKAIHDRFAIPFKRALGISASGSASDLKVAKKGVSDTFLTHDDLRNMNEQLLKAEMLRSYGIQLVHERRRCR